MNQFKAVIIVSTLSFICILCTGFAVHYKNPDNPYTSKAAAYIKDKTGYDLNKSIVTEKQYIPEKWQYRKNPEPVKVINNPRTKSQQPMIPIQSAIKPAVQAQKQNPVKGSQCIAHKPKIYSWTDEKGIKHYTDIKPKDLSIVERAWDAEVSKHEHVQRYTAKSQPHNQRPPTGSGNYNPVLSYEEKPKKKKTGFKEISRGIYECDGYTFNISANRVGNILNIRGRVSDGENCENLKAIIKCQDKNGWPEYVTVNLNNIGPGKSDIIREDIHTYAASEKWEITDIDVICTAD